MDVLICTNRASMARGLEDVREPGELVEAGTKREKDIVTWLVDEQWKPPCCPEELLDSGNEYVI